MGFFGFINCYTLRVNLSVAIVAMVNTTYLRELEAAAAQQDNDTSLVDVCAVDGDNQTHVAQDIVRISQTDSARHRPTQPSPSQRRSPHGHTHRRFLCKAWIGFTLPK